MKTIFFLIILPLYIYSQSSDECFDCHNDEELEFSRGDKTVSLYVNPENYHSSIHADMDCIDCHTDFDPEEIPHREGENIASVECSDCHETDDFNESVHGLVNVDCFSCHTKHSIQEASYLDNIS
ncbi:MAG: hypothetical protein R3250_15515, partial [Melioribacteraceae bacterium]|nr:hypothetical protein [Melioribacteraceae bacterium]